MRLLIVISLLIVADIVVAQNSLKNSVTRGYINQVYKLTDKEIEKLIDDPKAASDAFLHTLVDSYTNTTTAKELPYGNYLRVSPIKNQLVYSLITNNNVSLTFINNFKEFQFIITDTKGIVIPDAKVYTSGGKVVTYNKRSNLYKAQYPKEDGYVKVTYNGVSNYFTYNVNNYWYNERHSRTLKQKVLNAFPVKHIRTLFVKSKTNPNNKLPVYNGFMVFSKPIYKPYDTVKLKAYILNQKGEPVKTKQADIMLRESQGVYKKLSTISAYNNGAFEYKFVLNDSLNLKLDVNYAISIVDSSLNIPNLISGNFKYEEYELKSLNFGVRADKKIHYPNEPITLYLKATDENELTVPDARVEIVARTQHVSKFYSDSIFVKDTLLVKNMNLDPVGETKLILPDSIFPKAALSFTLFFKMLNSNNESRTATEYLSFDALPKDSNKQIIASFVKDSLLFSYKEGLVEKHAQGWLYIDAPSGETIDSMRMQMPLHIAVDYRADDYYLKLDNGLDTLIGTYDFEPDIKATAFQKENKLSLFVINPHKIPFWYTVFSGNKTLLKGYTNRLDTTIYHTSKQAAHLRINYLWDAEERQEEVSTYYNPNELNIKLLSPDAVYPGQKVNMKIRVLNTKEIPVEAVDITAYAQTTKFNASVPSIPRFGKIFYARKTKPCKFESEEIYASGAAKMNWQRWSRQLGLDTIEYYKFTHPKALYITTESATNNITQFAPFVMQDGDFEPVSIIYVDGTPIFYYAAEQLQHYAFPITPGRHSINLRTPRYDIWLRDVHFKEGVKTIFSVLVDQNNPQAQVAKRKPVLSPTESERLNRYMVRITDNFEGAKAFVIDNTTKLWLNAPPNITTPGQEKLIGPLMQNLLFFQTPYTSYSFFKEPGYTYTFSPGLIKQKSYRSLYAFDTVLKAIHPLAENYKQEVLKNEDYDSIWNEFLNLRSFTNQLYQSNLTPDTSFGKLQYSIDTAFTNRLPYIKNILISNPAKPHQLLILNGNNTSTQNLPAGMYDILFLLRDNRYFKIRQVHIIPGGTNYYHWHSFPVNPADSFSHKLDAGIKSYEHNRRYAVPISKEIVRQFNSKDFDFSKLERTMSGRVVDATYKNPIVGASVVIEGFSVGVVTDGKGYFKLNVPKKGKVTVSMVGYVEETLTAINGDAGIIELSIAANHLEEVVVIGYGTARKKNLTGAATSIQGNEIADKPVDNFTSLLQGKLAGVNITSNKIDIRGNSSVNVNKNPLIIVDGVPFSGNLESLNPNDIITFDIIKPTDATAIYGARASDGVIIIKTKKGNTLVNGAGELVAGEQRLRTRFSDEGFWVPALTTDEKGEASFTITFPDDITNWKTRVIAINGKKQSGYLETSIKSFKTLSANFVSPLFAVEGDSIYVMGKLMNYTPLPERLKRILKFNGQLLRNDTLTINNAHIDTTLITVQGTDSLNFEYSLQQTNGYFDGELRKLPVYTKGVKETLGSFFYMDKDTVVTYNFDKEKGLGTVRAEASVFPVLLDEMRKLRDYEYLCNEQLASKLKSLLLEKKLRGYLKEPFEYDKHIKEVIKKLNENKSMQGLWGWWQGTHEEIWISLHVVEALLLAEAQGYATRLNKDLLYRYLLEKVTDAGAKADLKMIRLLYTLDGSHNVKDWIQLKESDSTYKKKKKPLYEWLQMQELRQMAQLSINTDSLISLQKSTMFGGIYWGEQGYHFWNNSIQNTLLAYRILKNMGNKEGVLEKIRQYFLEQRRNGQWRNTFESSLILETILPDLFKGNEKPKPASAWVNGEHIKNFPFEKHFPGGEKITLSKGGDMPIYFTAYQQFQNPNPQKISKDFEVNSYFIQQGVQCQNLKAGKTTILRVEVNVRADAEYVMVEVPIPAGCSYENKQQNFWGVETHREYFKNKTAIFCTSLKQGNYIFDIELMPRYSGIYHLNPPKAEMMYFPVFYGREAMKKVTIQ